jgi:D-alanyl-D-alanine carboxypeptidase/D-alanyl-D-alanine-endopeptidase (penicillin-binding protein 4)
MNSATVRLALLLLVVLPASASVCATSLSKLPGSVASALAQAGVPESQIGIYVHDLSSDQEVLSFGAERALNPASTMKLLTTFAALELLGPAYTWKTEAWIDGTLSGKRLEGNLVLKGHGDPKFNVESLWLFLRDLRNRGMRDIAGDLLLDRSYFAVDSYDPALFDNEPSRPYNVGPDALLINYKTFRLQFVPDEERRTVGIFSEPALPQTLVVNNLRLGPGSCDVWPERPGIYENTLTFSGVFPSGCGEKFRYFSLLSANDYAQTLFRQFWQQVGGNWSGHVRDAELPATAKLFATWESAPLSELIRDVNKFSINVMARQIFLTLGAREAPPATLEKSQRALREWLGWRGLSLPELVVENGAGLSRIDRISSRHLGQVLIAAYRSPLMPEFIASLPLAAIDGTMKKRLNTSPVAGQAHIKTGYIEGVRALAGYTLDVQGRMLVVVLIINHPGAHDAQPVQDALLEWVYAGQTGR